jgi:hypothetical protein
MSATSPIVEVLREIGGDVDRDELVLQVERRGASLDEAELWQLIEDGIVADSRGLFSLTAKAPAANGNGSSNGKEKIVRTFAPRTCEGCGKEYTPTSPRQKYCRPGCGSTAKPKGVRRKTASKPKRPTSPKAEVAPAPRADEAPPVSRERYLEVLLRLVTVEVPDAAGLQLLEDAADLHDELRKRRADA